MIDVQAAGAARAAAPAGRLPSRFGRPHLVMARDIMVHRHQWTILAFGILEPVLYLLSIGADFQLLQPVMLPMFLFATTFYPLRVYPAPIRVLVSCLPLYHSINLVRNPILGSVGTQLLVPAAYLAVMGLLGLWLAVRRLERIL